MAGERLRTAVLGYGYWGRNIARVLSESSDFSLHTICDPSPRALENAKRIYPYANFVGDYKQISDEVDAVAIITPANTHFELGQYFLNRGKHILITKPFARNLGQARELVALADTRGKVAFADHTFIFNPAVRTMKTLLPKIGRPYFVISQRLNLGLYQPDVNVIMDLMPHDVSIICYLLGGPLKSTQRSSFHSARLPQADLAHCTFEMKEGITGMVTVSWLSPFKIRQFFVVGSDGMLSYDDVAVSEKVKFYDRGISHKPITELSADEAYTSRIDYRSGDMFSPAVPQKEALALELQEFKKAITDRETREYYNGLTLSVMESLDSIMAPREELPRTDYAESRSTERLPTLDV